MTDRALECMQIQLDQLNHQMDVMRKHMRLLDRKLGIAEYDTIWRDRQGHDCLLDHPIGSFDPKEGVYETDPPTRKCLHNAKVTFSLPRVETKIVYRDKNGAICPLRHPQGSYDVSAVEPLRQCYHEPIKDRYVKPQQTKVIIKNKQGKRCYLDHPPGMLRNGIMESDPPQMRCRHESTSDESIMHISDDDDEERT